MSRDDPFAAGAHLAKASRHDYLFAWRRFLSFLDTHEPTALELHPSERLSCDRVRAFRAHLAETNAPRSVAGIIGALYHAARLMMAERDWSWLRAAKKRLDRDVPAFRASGPIITSIQLLDIGEELMEESKPRPDNPVSKRDAIQFRDGLTDRATGCIPIRRKNLAELEIGRQLIREGDRWFVVVPAEEFKDGNIDAVPSSRISGALPRSLSRYRSSGIAPAPNLSRALGETQGRASVMTPSAGFSVDASRVASASASPCTTHVTPR